MTTENRTAETGGGSVRPAWHRRRYLTEPRIQLGPAWRILAACVVPVFLAAAVFVHSLLNGTPSWCTEMFDSYIKLVTAFTACLVATATAAAFWVALHLHRLTGFVKRLEKHLDRFDETGHWQEIHLRKNDLMRGFVERLNRTMNRVSSG